MKTKRLTISVVVMRDGFIGTGLTIQEAFRSVMGDDFTLCPEDFGPVGVHQVSVQVAIPKIQKLQLLPQKKTSKRLKVCAE